MSTARAKEVFLAALELASSERKAFVDAECSGDDALRKRVEALLDVHENAEELLRVADPAPAGFEDGLVSGVRVGPFQLIEELGEGGFGTVWLAEQLEPVRRPVALKILKAGVDTREVVHRFEAERQALALMDHPSIAKVFEGGTTDRGRPYFAMELVVGSPITAYCEEHSLRVRERLELFLEVCRAVQHAHQKGIIHRDLKPNNVLVTEVDGRPLPKVIDFGIAKALHASSDRDSLMTREGQVIGTPAYMSPEQLGGSTDVDTRADVYALGVLLYELLVGAPPFEERELQAAGFEEIARLLRDVDPPKPSTRIGRGANTTAISWRSVRGDLDWIVMRCLEKDRERRYGSAAILATDVLRHLEGDTVLAGPPNLLYRTRKFVRRHQTALAVCVLLFASLLIGAIAAARQARRAIAAEKVARLELENKDAIAQFLERMLLSVDPAVALGQDTELMRGLLEDARDDVDAEPGPPEVERTLRRVIGHAFLSIRAPEEAVEQLERVLELSPDASGEELANLLDEVGGALLHARRFEDARPLFERALGIAREELGEGHEVTQNVLGNLALVFRYSGDPERAEEMLRTLLAAQLEAHGEVHEEVGLTTNNLAGIARDTGRHEEAAELFERALAIQLEVSGEKHPRSALALNNLGECYLRLERTDEAEELFERALALKRELFDADNPSILVTWSNLAYVHEQRGDVERALEVQRAALEHAYEHIGRDNNRTLQLAYNHGSQLLQVGDWDRALEVLEEATAGRRPQPGVAPALLVLARSGYGEALVETGSAAEGEPELRAALEEARAGSVFPDGTATWGVLELRLGRALLRLGRDEEARATLERAQAALGEGGDPVHRERLREAFAALDDSAVD